jgi:Tfp pilus assembly protein PilF
MMSSTAERVDRLLDFLKSDPDNLNLLRDAAEAALADGRFALAQDLVDRHAAVAPPPPPLVNLAGLAAMGEGRFAAAAVLFARCLEATPDEPTPRYNLAWARAAQRDWAGASELLDESVAAAIPAAATLKVQMLHHLGEVEDALAWGAGFVDRYPNDLALLGALSAVAMDAEELELAAGYAERAGESPEGLATLGMLRLDQAGLEAAEQSFDRALSANGDCARALLGKGLVGLARSDSAAAASYLDRAASFYGDHLGSWVAAGWAYFTAGDLVRARQRFETAVAVDGTFAEAQGGLAVIDVIEGRLDEGRRRAQTALRLDRMCFSGVLARSLLLEAEGETAAAERLRNAALNVPVGPSGQTIAQMAALLGARRR